MADKKKGEQKKGEQKKEQRPFLYRLEGHAAVPLGGLTRENLLVYAESLEGERHVAVDEVEGGQLSTVFLGLDHNHHSLALNLSVEEAPPLIFETALLQPESVTILSRYPTWEAALEGHRRHLAALTRRN